MQSNDEQFGYLKAQLPSVGSPERQKSSVNTDSGINLRVSQLISLDISAVSSVIS